MLACVRACVLFSDFDFSKSMLSAGTKQLPRRPFNVYKVTQFKLLFRSADTIFLSLSLSLSLSLRVCVTVLLIFLFIHVSAEGSTDDERICSAVHPLVVKCLSSCYLSPLLLNITKTPSRSDIPKNL